MTVYMEAKRRVFAEMMAKMDEHLQQTGELVVPDIDIFSVDKLAVELSRACEYKPMKARRSDPGKKREPPVAPNGPLPHANVNANWLTTLIVAQQADGVE